MGPRMKYVLLMAFLLTVSHLADGRKTLSSGRKTTSGGSGRRRTTPRQPNADAAKLSYPQQNAHQPNQQPPQIGWNPPKQEGPAVAVNKPPSYSQSNMGPPPDYSRQNVQGAQVNRGELPPQYTQNAQSGYPHANAPPAYPGIQQSHAAPNYQQPSHQQPSYQQPSYQQPSYQQPSYHQPAGGYPQQPNFYPQPGQQPIYQGAGIQPGYYPAGSLPQQKSSGPGLATGLIAGGLGGALLGHALTPSRDNERIIVIHDKDGSQSSSSNPNSVPSATAAPVPQPNPVGGPVAPMAPGVVPMIPGGQQQPSESPVPLASFPANSMSAPNQQPTLYENSCMPVQVNETDPQDPSKIITRNTVVCYNGTQPNYPVPNTVPNADGYVPLAPMPQPNMGGPMSMNMERPVPLAPFSADSLTSTNQSTPLFGTMCVPVQVNNTDTVVCYNITQAPGSTQPELLHDKNTPKPLLGTIAQRNSAARLSMPMSFSFITILKTITMFLCAYSIF